MAHRMTWAKVHADAFSNRKVMQAANEITRGDVEKMVGHLARLWTWAADNAEDGDLSHLLPAKIAEAAGWKRSPGAFVDSLAVAGLLDHESKVNAQGEIVRRFNFRIHDWDEYVGQLVARRRTDRDRKRRDREEVRTSGGPQERPTDRPQDSRQDVHNPREETEEEKRERAGSPEGSTGKKIATRSEALAVADALSAVPGYTPDSDLEQRLAALDEVDAAIEQILRLADHLDQPGMQRLSPDRQAERIEGWLRVADLDVDLSHRKRPIHPTPPPPCIPTSR